MTTEARYVLQHCKLAAQELKKTDFEEDRMLWQLRWISLVALLRCVLHVHIKFDKSKMERVGNIQKYNEFFTEKSGERICKDFIIDLRNLLLKEFNFKHVQSKEFSLLTEDNQEILLESGDKILLQYNLFIDGFNKPLHKLIDEALIWLENFLNEVDCRFLK